MQILFATTNPGKLHEVQSVATTFGITVVSPTDIPLKDRGSPPEVCEDADTYEGNAALKANAFWKWGGLTTLADDTGLEVTSLEQRPGVYSARYAGVPPDSVKNVNKLLGELKGVDNRSARFVCVLHLKKSEGEIQVVKETLEGEIAHVPSGSGGFGYDNIFIVEGYYRTLAQLKEDGVPVLTHRLKALKKLFSSEK